MTRRLGRALAAALLLLGTGCCAGPQTALEAFDPRLELATRTTFAIICPVLDDPRAWAYADAPAALRALEGSYRPDPTRRPPGVVAPFPDPRGILPAAAAPPALTTALRETRAALTELGYRPVEPGAHPDLVVCLGITRRDGGRLDRIAVHLGAISNGRFTPFLLSLATTFPDDADGACPVPLAEAVGDLVRLLPPRGSEP